MSPSGSVWTVRRLLEWVATDFASRGISSPRLDAEILLAHALGIDRVRLYMDLERPLDKTELARVRVLVQRRRQREPVAYIVGSKEFWGRSFEVTPDVLIPRPDTETLIERALEIFKDLRPSKRFGASQLQESAKQPHAGPDKEKFERRLRVVDVGTGSGAIGLTLACEIPSAELTLIDRSNRALTVARRNLERLAKDDSTLLCRVRLLEGDLLAQPREGERFDLIVANLPYLSEKEWALCAPEIVKYEPREALVGGPEGHELILRLISEAPERLNPRGVFLLEIGHGQGQRIIRACQERGYSVVQLHRDLGGRERVVEAHWAS